MGFWNFKITNIKITKDKLLHFLFTNLFFYFLKGNWKIQGICYILIWKMMEFPKFNNLENLWNLEKISNTLSVQVIFEK